MGHERIGFLPHTKQWKVLTEQISAYNGDIQSAKEIADYTLDAIRVKYMALPYDESLIKAIRFIVTLSVSASKDDQVSFLQSIGYTIPQELTAFSILSNVNQQITTESGSLETNKIVRDSVMQAIIEYRQSKEQFDQLSLFSDSSEGLWKSIGNGAAFCEITRSFFAAFTCRQTILEDFKSTWQRELKLAEKMFCGDGVGFALDSLRSFVADAGGAAAIAQLISPDQPRRIIEAALGFGLVGVCIQYRNYRSKIREDQKEQGFAYVIGAGRNGLLRDYP